MLEELNYYGPLYHYTDSDAYALICNPHDMPSDCISLQFTRIDYMTKNDENERKHIKDTVKNALHSLLNQHKIRLKFVDVVTNYIPNQSGLSIQNINSAFEISADKVDYYVACFSTNPNNEYIKKHFKAQKRISFLPEFSYTFCSETQKSLPGVRKSFISFPALSLSPYPQLQEAKLFYDLKRVSYNNSEKNDIIQHELLQIYRDFKDLTDLQYRLQAMYSTYDAFFKSKQVGNEEYYKEEEVRFVIRLPEKTSQSLYSSGKIKFDTPQKEHLYLPIDKAFLDDLQ